MYNQNPNFAQVHNPANKYSALDALGTIGAPSQQYGQGAGMNMGGISQGFGG